MRGRSHALAQPARPRGISRHRGRDRPPDRARDRGGPGGAAVPVPGRCRQHSGRHRLRPCGGRQAPGAAVRGAGRPDGQGPQGHKLGSHPLAARNGGARVGRQPRGQRTQQRRGRDLRSTRPRHRPGEGQESSGTHEVVHRPRRRPTSGCSCSRASSPRRCGAMERQGNILSAVLRDAWDHGNLRTLIKNNANRAPRAHTSRSSATSPTTSCAATWTARRWPTAWPTG